MNAIIIMSYAIIVWCICKCYTCAIIIMPCIGPMYAILCGIYISVIYCAIIIISCILCYIMRFIYAVLYMCLMFCCRSVPWRQLF